MIFEREGGAVHYTGPPLAPEWETEIADGVACFWFLVWVRANSQFARFTPHLSKVRAQISQCNYCSRIYINSLQAFALCGNPERFK
jgi:hypothetical protein